MKVFVAGATGAIGKQDVPRLVANGQGVVRMTRTETTSERRLGWQMRDPSWRQGFVKGPA